MNHSRIIGTAFSIAATLLVSVANAQVQQQQPGVSQTRQAPPQTRTVQGDFQTRVAPEALIIAPPTAPRLGFTGQMLHGFGMKVLSVNPYSPAQRAGLEYGDVIKRINGFRIRSQFDYNNALIDAANNRGGVVSLRVKNVRGNHHLGIPHYVNVTAYLAVHSHPVPAVAASTIGSN